MKYLMLLPEDKKGIELVFIQGQDIDSTIEKIREQAKGLPTDMSIKKNRDEVASFAYKIARSKSAVEKAGAALSAEYKEIPKKIDANRRVYKEAFERLQEEVRSPLNQWEQAEKDRVAAHQSKIDSLKSNIESVDHDSCSITINTAIEMLNSLNVDESWEEFEPEAHRVKQKGLEQLRELLDRRVKYEAEQAELERLRKLAAEQEQKEREERIAKEAAEKAKAVAEAKQAELVAAAERAKAEAELAEQKRIAAEKQAELDRIQAKKDAEAAAEAARQQEIARQQAELERQQAEQAQREANKAHRAKVNRQALNDLVKSAGLTEDQAKLVVKAIASNLISAVTINY